MHIIFGDAVKDIPEGLTVLELDLIRAPNGNEMQYYCVVEQIPLNEFPLLEAHKAIHSDLIKYYKQREWAYCENAIEGLMGKWNGEVDTFYSDLLKRVIEYKENPPSNDWDGAVVLKVIQP